MIFYHSAVLDGIDLHLAIGNHRFYTDFIKELRFFEEVEGHGRHYLIAAAPSCIYPDGLIGPAEGKALGDVPELIDLLFVQYRSDKCSTADSMEFYRNLHLWLQYSVDNGGPEVFVGLPADVGAHSGDPSNWRSPTELAAIYNVSFYHLILPE